MGKIRVAFIKFGGLGAGGTERWLQMMAANLPAEQFEIDYFYCDSAPYVNSNYKHPDTDPYRLKYMQDHNIKLIKFSVGQKDTTKSDHPWVNTDFWQKFNSENYDLIQTAKAGPREYPYYLIPKPIVEFISLAAGVDKSPNIIHSIHLSQWQRAQWYIGGGHLTKSSVIPIPASTPSTKNNLRKIIGINENAVIAGFHQRAENTIYSPIPLNAFAAIQKTHQAVNNDWHFIIMGGGELYREQAKKLAQPNIHFLPHSGDNEQISAFLNTLDIFAHGRKDGETYGTVFAEAMAHGKPCLSHWSPIANGQQETIGPAGYFAQNQTDYTVLLTELFQDLDLRAKLAKKAIIHAKTYYSIENCAAKLGEEYHKLLNLPHQKSSSLQKIIQYGVVPSGFLYASNFDSPAQESLLIPNQTPHAFSNYILQRILPDIKYLVDSGAKISLHSLICTKKNSLLRVNIYESDPLHAKELQATIYLNNWEDRVKLNQKEYNDSHQEEVMDLLKIEYPQHDYSVKDLERKIIKDHPIIFIKTANQNSNLEWLKKNNYTIFQCHEKKHRLILLKGQEMDSEYFSLCLHKEKHADLIHNLPLWSRQFKIPTPSPFQKMIKKIYFAAKNPKIAAQYLHSRINFP